LTNELRAGVYPSGARLPSVRQLCADHAASLATVTRALHELEDAGLIESRPRQGFYARTSARSATAAPTAAAVALAGRRKRLMELATKQSECLSLGHLALPEMLLPLRALARLAASHLRADAALLGSGSVYGSPALRQQLKCRVERFGCMADVEDVVVTQGETEALELCLRQLTQPGALVAVASPAPFRTLELIASLGLGVLEIPATSEAGLSVPTLEFALQNHDVAVCILEPNFDVATGSLMSDSAKQQLVGLLAKHRLPLIECDMMGDLYRGTQRPRPLKAFDIDDRILYCGGFSCITGPGFNVGFVIGGRHRLQLRAARAVHGEFVSGLTDQVLTNFMASGGLDTHLRTLRRSLGHQVTAYRSAVVTSFPPGTRVDSGEGGYQLWVELPESLDACVLLEASRRRGYTFVPGAVFSTGTQFDHCLRLTAGHPLDESHFRGIQALGAIADQLLKSRASNKRTRKARTAIVA
jgi:DNA-binding transcriptional MocR family regulator